MSEWVEVLLGLNEAGTPAVLVTVLATEGSTPREAGAKLVVTVGATACTIGGGQLEHVATEEARGMLAEHAKGGGVSPEPRLRRLALGPSLGQCCGGAVTLLYELVASPAAG